MNLHTLETEVEINGEYIRVSVDFAYYPGEPEVWTYSNGDPGHPGSGPEVDIMVVRDENGREYEKEFTSKQVSELIDECIEYMEKERNWLKN